MTDQDVALIAHSLTPSGKRAIRNAKTHDDGLYVSPLAPVPASLIAHQVWGRGDKLNERGIAVREYLERNVT